MPECQWGHHAERELFQLNLTAICAWVAQAIAERRYQHRRSAYRVNLAFALSKMRGSVLRLLLGAASNTGLTALILAMARSSRRCDQTAASRGRSNRAKLHGVHPNYERCR
jgi:hypothetical protein